jgi:hypothetical protein
MRQAPRFEDVKEYAILTNPRALQTWGSKRKKTVFNMVNKLNRVVVFISRELGEI